MLRRWVICAGLLAVSASGVGCSHMSNTAQGAGAGGLIGAGAGGLIGAATGRPLQGAAVGGLLGAGVGGLVGNDIDMQEKRQNQRDLAVAQARATQAEARPAALGLTDIQRLAAQGLSDDVIVNQIRTTGSTFVVSAADIEWLKTNGVSDRVILEMQNARPHVAAPPPRYVRPGPTVIYAEPVPIYYVRPAPPPPSFHFGYVRVR